MLYENLISNLGLILMIIASIISILNFYLYYKRIPERLTVKERHSDELKGVIEQWISQLTVPSPEGCIIPSTEPHFKYKSKTNELEFDIESQALFKDIKNHLPNALSDLMPKWEEFKQNLSKYLKQCFDLFDQVCQESVKATDLPLKKKWGSKGIISDKFAYLVYHSAFEASRGGLGLADWQYKIEQAKDIRTLWLGGYGIARGSLKQINHCKRVHKELIKTSDKYSEKVKEISILEKELKNWMRNIRDILEELLLVPILPGKCKYMRYATEMGIKKCWKNFKESLTRRGSAELRETPRDLSNKSLVFAGFTLTILIFVAGFYRENLTQVSGVITFFLIGFILFLIGTEITRNVAFGWEYFIGEILYLTATAFIAGVLIIFFQPVLEGFVQNLSVIMILAYIGFLTVYILNSVYSLTRGS